MKLKRQKADLDLDHISVIRRSIEVNLEEDLSRAYTRASIALSQLTYLMKSETPGNQE